MSDKVVSVMVPLALLVMPSATVSLTITPCVGYAFCLQDETSQSYRPSRVDSL